MKKLSIFIGIFLFFLQAANAQNQKGDQTLGVSLGFYSNGNNYIYQDVNTGVLAYVNSQSTSFNTNPNYSYFVANNLDIGASIGFGSGRSNSNDHAANSITKQIDKNYNGSVYLRKYFLYNNKIGIRTGPYLAYQYFESNSIYSPNINQHNYNYSGKNYHAGLSADFVYYPSGKIGLAVNLGSLSYNHGTTNNQQQSTSGDGVNLSFLNNNLMLSAFYVFGN